MEEFTPTQKAILALIERRPGITMVDVAKALAMTYVSTEKEINTLITEKCVTKNGARLQRAGFIQWL